MTEDFEQIHQSIIKKEQNLSQLDTDMMDLIKENNQINNEINLCVQKINKTQSYVDDMNENKFMFLYDEFSWALFIPSSFIVYTSCSSFSFSRYFNVAFVASL